MNHTAQRTAGIKLNHNTEAEKEYTPRTSIKIFPSVATTHTTMEAVRERTPLMSDSNSISGQARDPEELEGTLLLPTAHSVPHGNLDDGVPMASTTVATAVPMTYFEYDQDTSEKQNEIVVEQAFALPSYDEFSNDPQRERDTLALAQLKGRIQTDGEIEEIKRASRESFAINYQTTEQIKEANRLAAATKRKEELGMLQTSVTIPKEGHVSPVNTKAPEFYKGSYGKDYEVGEYTTSEYDTSDYDVKEYKSVYEY
jgi:hypothetical protein